MPLQQHLTEKNFLPWNSSRKSRSWNDNF
jgi:hypothetical protein